MPVIRPLLYSCCDVAATGAIFDPCWNCQATGTALRPTDLEDNNPWNLFRALGRKQTATTARL